MVKPMKTRAYKRTKPCGEAELHVIGVEPENVPYVSIYVPAEGVNVVIDKRQMDALCRRWQKAHQS